MNIVNKIMGLIIGLIFGLVLFWAGVGPAFAVLAFMLLGWFIGKVVNGEIDLITPLYELNRKRRAEEERERPYASLRNR